MTPAEINAAMAEVHAALGAPEWARAVAATGVKVRLDRGWGHLETSSLGFPPMLMHCNPYLCPSPDAWHGQFRAWVVRSEWEPVG
jgi:hypothetical protein